MTELYLTKRQRQQLLFSQLETERSSFIPHWKELNDFFLPRRARFWTSDVNRGDRRSKNIIDSTGTFAVRTLSSGMMSGITSPARPWFRLTTRDPDLSEFSSVKEWLHDVAARMSSIFLRSNIYNVLPTTYGDMGVFATSALSLEENDHTVIRSTSFPIGSYMIANNEEGRVRVFAREFQMTVRQIVTKFGVIPGTTMIDWSRISHHVKNLWDRGNTEDWIDICHVVEPNEDHDPSKAVGKFMEFSSCYYEKGNDEYKYLRESGYEEFPIFCPRWDLTGEDSYGTSSPGMIALGDVKQLQLGEKRALQGLDKMVNPPLVAPTAMRAMKVSGLPGSISYHDERQGQHGIRPIHEVSLRFDYLEQKQQQVRYRIERAFYADLFLMMAQTDRRQITAREIEERHEEKLLALGPVLEQLNQDLLDPLIDRTFMIMLRKGLVPPPPEELQGEPLKIEYLSLMAQAQKMVGLSGLDRFAGFGVQIAQVNPNALDKFDTDQMIDEYAEMTGISPKIVVPDEEVQQIRQARAKAQQVQAQTEQLQGVAKSAKDLSETDTSNPNSALAQLIGMGGGRDQ